MKKYGNYSGIAKRIASNLPKEIGDTFTSLKGGRKTRQEMDGLMLQWSDAIEAFPKEDNLLSYDLAGFVLMIMMTADKTTDLHEDRLRCRDIRRNRKMYLKRAVDKEVETPDKGMFKKAWDMYLDYKDSPFFEEKFANKDEFISHMVEKVSAWSEEQGSNLVAYPLFKFMAPKKQAQDFLSDCSFHVFDLLTRSYGSELPQMQEGSDAPVMRTPSFISGKGVFGATSTVEDLETEVRHDSVTTYNNHTITTEDGQIIIKTIVDSVHGDFKEAETEEGRNAIVETLQGEGRIKLSNNLLDSVDLELFTHIFSAFNVEDVTRGRKMFKMRDLVKSLYTEAKDDRKNSVIDHLNRLGSYKVEYTASNVSGKTVEFGDISFFDIIYHIDDDEEGEVTYNASLHPADGTTTLLNEVKSYKADDITVEIRPSVGIRDAIMSSMNTVIYTELYKKIPAPKAKNMLMFLQSRRAEIYPETKLDISISFLAQNFRLEKLRRSKQVHHLSEMVDQLKDAGVLVKDYTIEKNLFRFEFLPFTETELEAYHIGGPALGVAK